MDNRRMVQLDNLCIRALNDGVFPGAAVGFSQWSGKAYECTMKHYGFSQLVPQKKVLKEGTFFDLASLTKPLVTVPVILSLVEQNKITLQSTLGTFFSPCPADKQQITIRELMTHSSGLPAYREYFHELIKIRESARKEEIGKSILQEKLLAKPGTKQCYSDLGFILLGLIIEKISGRNLDEEVEKTVFTPLALQNALFFAGKGEKKGVSYACTEKCLWERKMLCGRVHDDNCRALGGVAGHAGLFGTLKGVMQLCQQFLDQYKERGNHPAYPNALLRQAMTQQSGSAWTLGFDTPDVKGSSSGRYFSPESVGHLGFTGTSFWIDPIKECIAVVLTNRVHPSRENEKIKTFRPLVHDILMGE